MVRRDKRYVHELVQPLKIISKPSDIEIKWENHVHIGLIVDIQVGMVDMIQVII